MKAEATLLNSAYHKRSVAEVCLRCERSENACPSGGCGEYRRACSAAARPMRRYLCPLGKDIPAFGLSHLAEGMTGEE